jgi:hypothetical protein
MLPFSLLSSKLATRSAIALGLLLATLVLTTQAFRWHEGEVAQVVQETRKVVIEETKSADKQNASAIRDRVNAGLASERLQPKATGSDTRGYRD